MKIMRLASAPGSPLIAGPLGLSEAESVFGLSDKGDIIMGGNLKRD